MTKTNLSKMHGRRLNDIIKDKDISAVLKDLCKSVDQLSEEIENIKKRLPQEGQK